MKTGLDHRTVLAGLIVGLLCLTPVARAGKLGAVREAVDGDSCRGARDDGPEAGEDDSSVESPPDLEHSASGDFWGGWGWCFLPPIGLLACLPRLALEPPEDGPEVERPAWIPSGFFLPHPYAGGRPGQVFVTRHLRRLEPILVEETLEHRVYFDPALAALAGEQDLASWSVRLASEYAYDFGPVHRPSLLASIDSIYRLGITTHWTHYLEPLGDGSLDRLTVGDLNLTFRVAQSEHAQVRLGLGARMLAGGELAFGFNFTYLIDLFPVDPLVISLVADVGNLGAAFTARGRVTLGVQLGPFEPYLGYDLTCFTSQAALVLFQGPVAGLRVWL
jgi:hypothetical protein